jgi:membrane protease YdiL (CAAX protease family)
LVLPVHVFFASIVGFALGYVYYRTRSLGLVILIHFINNGASYFLGQQNIPTSSEEMIGMGMAGVLGLAAILTVAGVGLLYLLGTKYPLAPTPPEDLPEEQVGTGAQVAA